MPSPETTVRLTTTYNQELEPYLDQAEHDLRGRQERDEAFDRTICLTFWWDTLRGGAPAADLDVMLFVPASLKWTKEPRPHSRS